MIHFAFPPVGDRCGWRLSRELHPTVPHLPERHVLHQTDWLLQQVEYDDPLTTLYGTRRQELGPGTGQHDWVPGLLYTQSDLFWLDFG